MTNLNELTIGELDAVSGGDLFGLMGGSTGMLNQIMRIVQEQQNPAPPPTQSGPAQQWQQIMNGLNNSQA